MLDNNVKLLLFCAVFICVKNLIIARLYALISSKKPSIFLYDRKIIKQTFIIWAIATFSGLIGYILKYVLLYVSNTAFIKFGGSIISRYMTVTVNENPVICVVSFAVSFALCFLLVFIFGKILQIERRVITALLLSILCAPYSVTLPIKDFASAVTSFFGVIFILFLIPYFFYKHFSSLIYRINQKKGNGTTDKRIKCIVFAFVGQFIGIFSLLVLNIASDFALYIHDPQFSLQDTTYGDPNIPLIVFSVSILVGALCNLLLLLRFCFTPKKPNIKSNLLSSFALFILNAPYVLFIFYFIMYLVQ